MGIQLEDSVSRTGFENPFYVVVHAKDVHLPAISYFMDVSKFCKVLSEIDFIRNFEDYVELNQHTSPETILSGIPKDRPLLVCGFFGDICVRQQRDALKNAGYDAYVCSEATYFSDQSLCNSPH